MINIFHRSAEFVQKHKRHLLARARTQASHHLFLAVLALVIAGTGVYTYRHEIASAATFTFAQANTSLGGGGWTGLDTATPLATHTSNQSNWSKYSAKSTYINADANGISLPSTAKSITDDGAGLSAKTDSTTGGASTWDVVVSPDGTSVYAVKASSASVSMFTRNTSTGALSGGTNYTTGTTPYSVAISPDGTSVYVANGGSASVSMFTRDTSNGTLSAKTDVTTGTTPRGVAVSPDGKSVYTVNNDSSSVSMFTRNTSDGTLSAKTDYTALASSLGIVISPDGTSVYVSNSASNFVSMFTRNTSDGTLSAKTDYTAWVAYDSPAISPDGKSVYVLGNNGVSMFTRNTSDGTLSAKTDYSAGGNTYGVAVSPDGTSVYVVNAGVNAVSMFLRNTSTGALSSKTNYTTGTAPRGIDVSSDGTSVYVANSGSASVSMYSRVNGPGFESGTNSNTAISGSGSSASVRLEDTSTGGTATTSGAYTIRTFTSSGTFTPAFSDNLEALVVGGGGGGGNDSNTVSIGSGGGGGGGGVVNSPTFAVTAQQAYTVTVGGGGSNTPTSGSNSVFGSITATGGGRGGYCPVSSCTGTTKGGAAGGSGGGGLGSQNSGYAGGAGTAGQGNDGGVGFLDATNGSGGGGGGAGGPGATSTSGIGGNGGNGLPYSTSGASVTYGGGGGGAVISGTSGTGGTGGGGNAPGGVGTVNTGGGGGAGVASVGGAGGSGVVVVKYPSPLSGTFTSSVIDTGAKSNFTTLAYTATLNGQTLTVDIRAGDSATAPAWGSTDANWTSTGLTNVANTGSIAGLGAHRYVQYRANLSTNDGSISPTLDNVVINSTQYSLGGNLTSSVYDAVDSTNILAGVSWTSGSTSGTETVALQVRSSADNATWTNWCGATSCNNTDTFTTSPSTISSSHPIRTDGVADRYVQYKVFLASGGSVTPSVTQVVLTYVVNASPVVGNIVATQVSDSASSNYGKVSFSFDASDSDTTTGSPANQLKLTPTLYEYSTNGGGAWTTISSGITRADGQSAYSVITLTGDSATTTTSVTWTPTTGIAMTSTAKIRVTVTDSEAANATAVGTMSGTFTLDRTPPVVTVANINSSGTQDVVNLTATDGSALEYRLCNVSDYTGCATWTSLTSGTPTAINWTASGGSGAETVYLQVRDLYGNVNTTPASVIAPATPGSLLAADVSNPPADTFGETLSWLAVANATSYNVYYATTTSSSDPMPSTFTLLSSPASNVYAHTITTATTSAYWYKVRAVNANGDISNYATIATGDVPDSFGTSLSDTTPPVISNISAPTESLRSASVVVTFTTDELATSTVLYGTSFLADCSYNNTKTTTSFVTSQSVTVDNLQPSTTYYYCVKATDVVGNTSLATSGGTFATVGGPTISSVTVQNLAGTSATIMWNTATSSDSYIYYSTSNSLLNPVAVGSTTMVPCTGSVCQHQVGLSGLTSGTIYYFKVKSTDSDSNTVTDTNSGSYYSFTTLADTTAPAIVGTIETPVKAPTAAVIVWQTDEPATSQANWGLASTTLTRFTANDTTKSIYHVVTLSSGTLDTTAVSQELTAETAYYFTVTSADAANNSMTSGVQTFTTPSSGNVTITVVSVQAGDTKDTTPPSISNVTVSDITPFSAVVKFSTDEDTVAGVDAGATQTYGQTASSFDWAKTHTIKLRGLTLGTEYHIRVKAVDKAGNTGTSADQTFKTTFLSENLKDMANVENIEQFQKEIENAIESILPSLVPPFITKPIISDITEGGAKVSFKSNIKAFPVVVFAEDGAYDETKENPYTGEVSDTAEKATSHELLLTGLKGNTTYHIQARAFSLPKVLGKSVDVTFITKASKIAGSIVERKKDSFTVVWTTDQPTTTIVEYKDLKRGITQRKTDDAKKTSHSMKIENLPSGTAYEVNLSGMTEQGNIAEAGSPLSVTTSTDVTPPAISGFKVDNALVPGRTDRIQTIVSWVTDEPGNSTVYYEEGAGTPGDTKELTNKNESLDSYTANHSTILPNLKPGTIYRLKVTSSDDSGNIGSFGPRTVITPKQTESITDIIFKNFEDSFKFMRKI